MANDGLISLNSFHQNRSAQIQLLLPPPPFSFSVAPTICRFVAARCCCWLVSDASLVMFTGGWCCCCWWWWWWWWSWRQCCLLPVQTILTCLPSVWPIISYWTELWHTVFRRTKDHFSLSICCAHSDWWQCVFFLTSVAPPTVFSLSTSPSLVVFCLLGAVWINDSYNGGGGGGCSGYPFIISGSVVCSLLIDRCFSFNCWSSSLSCLPSLE